MNLRTRVLAFVPLSLAALASAPRCQESRPQSRHSREADIGLIQDFRAWAAAHPDAAARLKARMDRNEDGLVDENERGRALEILVEKRAEMREWVEAHPRLPAEHKAAAGEKLPEGSGSDEGHDKKEQERARKLFVREDSEVQVQPKERPPIQKKADAKPGERGPAGKKPARGESVENEGNDRKEPERTNDAKHGKTNDTKRERRDSEAERQPAPPPRSVR